MDLYLPSLPALGRDLHATAAAAQLTMSLCMVGLALGQLVAGPLSDRVGRRRPLAAGVAVYAVTSLLCAFAPGIWILTGLRLLQGLAGAFGLVIARAMVRDLFSGEQAARVFSTLMLVTGLAPVIAPLAGGELARVTDWRGMFLVLAAAGAALFLAALTLPETLPPQARHPGGLGAAVAQFGVLGRDRNFAGYALVLSLVSCGLFTYISLSSFVFQNVYGLSAQQFSLIFALNSFGIIVASSLNRTVVARLGSRRLLSGGIWVGVLGGAVALGSVLAHGGLPVLLPGLFFVAAGAGLVLPNATALAMDPHAGRAGSASALIGMLQFITGAVVPPLVSGAGVTGLTMTATVLACGAAALLVSATVTSPRPLPATGAAVPGGLVQAAATGPAPMSALRKTHETRCSDPPGRHGDQGIEA